MLLLYFPTAEQLGAGAFCYCRRLYEVVFEKDSQLTTIGECCFFGCGLESFTIPKNV